MLILSGGMSDEPIWASLIFHMRKPVSKTKRTLFFFIISWKFKKINIYYFVGYLSCDTVTIVFISKFETEI